MTCFGNAGENFVVILLEVQYLTFTLASEEASSTSQRGNYTCLSRILKQTAHYLKSPANLCMCDNKQGDNSPSTEPTTERTTERADTTTQDSHKMLAIQEILNNY